MASLTSIPDGILYPVAAHLLWVFVLFVLVSLGRKRAVKDGQIEHIDRLATEGTEPSVSRRYAANLNNQFEMSTFFYPLIALLYATNGVTTAQIALAWLFVAGRFAHSAVQTQTDNVQLRGMVFGINFVAVMAMWALFIGSRLASN